MNRSESKLDYTSLPKLMQFIGSLLRTTVLALHTSTKRQRVNLCGSILS